MLATGITQLHSTAVVSYQTRPLARRPGTCHGGCLAECHGADRHPLRRPRRGARVGPPQARQPAGQRRTGRDRQQFYISCAIRRSRSTSSARCTPRFPASGCSPSGVITPRSSCTRGRSCGRSRRSRAPSPDATRRRRGSRAPAERGEEQTGRVRSSMDPEGDVDRVARRALGIGRHDVQRVLDGPDVLEREGRDERTRRGLAHFRVPHDPAAPVE